MRSRNIHLAFSGSMTWLGLRMEPPSTYSRTARKAFRFGESENKSLFFLFFFFSQTKIKFFTLTVVDDLKQFDDVFVVEFFED